MKKQEELHRLEVAQMGIKRVIENISRVVSPSKNIALEQLYKCLGDIELAIDKVKKL